ncbi:uncharacterized protein LOC128673424 isoform X2 [Plodia interpunctella]|uniref:uncharacterized protein LOC128673424 isoform X2 n=1 Tax=Plodia interpunctella TaxID=58824 RepID=UPI002367E6D7|nr:uncharacterized protein LOC128673424 isoform X2 [Plodia interpunctella]
MSKKIDTAKSALMTIEVDPSECPFREFRDNELHPDFWGLGPAANRAAMLLSKQVKPATDAAWVDDQTQPLPRSVRQYLHGWIRAEELALDRWEAEVLIFEDNNDGGRMSQIEIQLSHAQVLLRSSFCRRVMSACFMLERIEAFTVEHQWENFIFSLQPDGWRARYHIYSPGMKPGGGAQHRPGLSKNGCYLVRLFYLGAWRCIWVSDQVPVDATDSPLLPFSPLIIHTPKSGPKQVVTTVTAPYVHLWPLLLCKALLKLAAPDMNSDEGMDCAEDEPMSEFSVLHALTGSMQMIYRGLDAEGTWDLITQEVPTFAWDEDDDTMASTVKSKSTKKPLNKENSPKGSVASVLLEDTKNLQPYALPGITPAHEMDLLVTMARDLPLKKPLPEPEVSPWKYYRWIDWAKRHGLYDAYDCPRTRFLKVNGLLKLSHAPHLLDVGSTESITFAFREQHEKTDPLEIKKNREAGSKTNQFPMSQQMREELREWIHYNELIRYVKNISIIFYPSMYEFTSAASSPPIRVTKVPPNRAIDVAAPKCEPLYLQIDGPEVNTLRMSLNVMHPRILLNSGIPIVDYIEPGYMVLERFEWFKDCELPVAKGFIQTRGYDSIEVSFQPGRHFCRLWIHSRTNWHIMLLSESALLLGPRDLIQCASVRECPWAARFLSNLSAAFISWVRGPRSTTEFSNVDRDFYRSYQPDLEWDPEVVGYEKFMIHWMFRNALQAHLTKKLLPAEYHSVCSALRRYFCDPDFGFPPKPLPTRSLREIADLDPCDCLMPEMEEIEQGEEVEEQSQAGEAVSVVDSETMRILLSPPTPPIASNICELATEEVPCGVLKEERDKAIKRHEAATILQAHWRGTWARMCMNSSPMITADVMRIILESTFGNLESLSNLMNEFFSMYPGARYAYSVASALSGVYGLQQHTGITHVKPKCIWVPFFQGTFYCHSATKVHLDVTSTLPQSVVAIYDNDTGFQLPQVFHSHITFDVNPNTYGYSVLGHGALNQPHGSNADIHWQITVLCCTDGSFHVCDNDPEVCKELPLQSSTKLHIDEIFIPNRRNILGGVQISVSKHEIVSFRAAATAPELELEAVLRSATMDGEVLEISRCTGKGELYWPYIRLVPFPSHSNIAPIKKQKSYSQANLQSSVERPTVMSARSIKGVKGIKPSSAKNRSVNKFKVLPQEPKVYTIEVIAPEGWPLTLAQWKRVDEVRNSVEKVETAPKKPVKEKPSSAKDKAAPPPPAPVYQPQPDDAYVELECAYSTALGAVCKRDDERDQLFASTIKHWEANEPGRNLRGAQIRKDFRTDFLEALPPPPTESVHAMEEMRGEVGGEEEEDKQEQQQRQGPSPITESGMIEMSVETEEEARYLTLPDQLRDKFIPLYFLPFCTKEIDESESVVLTPDMAEAAKQDRHVRIEVALERMRELQLYNELYVLGRQKRRAKLLETLFLDSQWNPDLAQVMYERDDAIATETLNRTLSANKKKAEAKVKK